MHFAAALAAKMYFCPNLAMFVIDTYHFFFVTAMYKYKNFKRNHVALLHSFSSGDIPKMALVCSFYLFLESFLCLFWYTSGHQIYAITLPFVHLLIQGYLLHAPAPITPLAHLHGEWCD